MNTRLALDENRAWTVQEMADYLNTTKKNVWGYARSGRLTLTYIGERSPRVTPEDRKAFLESCRKTA